MILEVQPLAELKSKWFGAPIFINGNAFCLNGVIETQTNDGPSVKHLAVNIYCLSEIESESVKMTYKIELHSAKEDKGAFVSGGEITFDEDHGAWGIRQFVRLTEVLADYYDRENDSCTVTAHITEVEHVEEESGESAEEEDGNND